MFLRVLPGRHAGLNCQSRYLLQEQGCLWQYPAVLRNATVRRRWQSAQAQANAYDEVEDKEDVIPKIIDGDEPDDDGRTFRWVDQRAEETRGPNEPVPRRKKQSGPVTFRHYTPAPTKALTTQMLGESAEILVLPEAPKRSWDIANDDDEPGGHVQTELFSDSEPRKTISEILAEESKPATTEQVFSSIEEIAMLHQETLDLSTTRASLRRGFTRAQLQKYAEHIEILQPGKFKQKSALLDLITAKVSGVEAVAATEQESPAKTRKPVNVPRHLMHLLIKIGRLDDLSTKYAGADLELLPRKQGLIVQAPDPDVVAKAVRQLQSWKRGLVSRDLTIPSILLVDHKNDAQESARSSFVLRPEVRGLLDQSNVAIDASKHKICAVNHEHLDVFERDLILLAHRRAAKAEQSQMTVHEGQSSTDERYGYVPADSHRTYIKSSLWHRQVASKDNPSSDNMVQYPAALNDLEIKLKQQLQGTNTEIRSQAEGLMPLITIGHLESTISALVGRWLSVPNRQVFDTETTRIPFLQRLLRSTNVTEIKKSLNTPKTSPVPEAQQNKKTPLTRLAFKPYDHTTSSPELRVLCSSRFDSSINVEEVSLEFGAIPAIFPYPSSPVDFQISTNSSISIFKHGKVIDPAYVPFLSDLGGNLLLQDASDKARSPSFKLILSLRSPSSVKSGEKENKEEVSKAKPVHSKFVLERAELIEQSLYRLPEGADGSCTLESTAAVPLAQDAVGEPRITMRLIVNDKITEEGATTSVVAKRNASKAKPMSKKDRDAQQSAQEGQVSKMSQAVFSFAQLLQEFKSSEQGKLAKRYPVLD